MLNIVIIAHSEIANSFAYCAEHVLSRRIENLYTLPVKKTDSPDDTYDRSQKLLVKLGGEILILSDIFGATPCNVATKLVKAGQIELITGINLNMLIRAISYSNKSLNICIEKTLEGGHNGIIQVVGGLDD